VKEDIPKVAVSYSVQEDETEWQGKTGEGPGMGQRAYGVKRNDYEDDDIIMLMMIIIKIIVIIIIIITFLI